ncbi:MAG: 30S ribosome-binding factor RbfA [Lentisphaerae bacterium]|jgi:ribosome-binding factor A|nr:30S ribosome-binding factor RbfA [Lentisphaerota bacterium]
MSNTRITRVNELLRRELGNVFQMLVCPEAETLVTVTGVDTAPNLRNATVYVSVYGDESAGERILQLIIKKRSAIQATLASKVILKYTPILHFKLDQTAAKADRVMSIISELGFDNEPNKGKDKA